MAVYDKILLDTVQNLDIEGSDSISHKAEQSGAAEVCWAHNPEVDGSKPSSAKHFVQQLYPVF